MKLDMPGKRLQGPLIAGFLLKMTSITSSEGLPITSRTSGSSWVEKKLSFGKRVLGAFRKAYCFFS